MAIYWFLFLYPLFGLIVRPYLSPALERSAWWILASIWILTIGFRIEIGCDWDGYLQLYENFRNYGNFGDLTSVNGTWYTLFNWDPGYVALTWASAKIGLGIYGVNVACGTLIVFGLATFCSKMPSKWLAWLVATPYMLTVISVGYSRQAVAIGFLFWGLSFLLEKKRNYFFLSALIAVTFHKTALFLLPVGVLSSPVLYSKRVLIVLILLLGPAAVWLISHLAPIYLLETNSNYYSAGSPVRALMNAVPAALLLLLHKRWKTFYGDSTPWVWLAIASIVAIFIVVFETTVVDRIGLYLLPIQVYVWSRLPSLPMVHNRGFSQLVTGFIVFLYGLTHFVWLNFALHNECYIPYRNLLLNLLDFSQ